MAILTRRQFLGGCSAAIAALAGGRVGSLAFAQPGTQTVGTDEILVMVFLRGGCDGLSLVAPFGDPKYVSERGNLIIPDNGDNKALVLDPQNSSFSYGIGFHPSAGPLAELYQEGSLAIVHACGLTENTRSHFAAMDAIERGVLGNPEPSSGWLTRHLLIVNPDGQLPTLVPTTGIPTSLSGSSSAVTMTTANSYASLSAPWRYRDSSMLTTLAQIYSGAGSIKTAGTRAIATIEALQSRNLEYTPDTSYPDESFGSVLKLVAQIVKLDVGLRVATVDFGGWDTHEYQGEYGSGYFATQVNTLARGLHAFYDDLAAYQQRLTVVVMSEFGRRLRTNTSQGTDHGHGGVMLVLGGNVNGGKIYGEWPGLDDLDWGQDLKVTTDFRTVLSEILVRRLGNPRLGRVFPEFSPYNPLGIVRGPDQDIDYTIGTWETVYLPIVRG